MYHDFFKESHAYEGLESAKAIWKIKV